MAVNMDENKYLKMTDTLTENPKSVAMSILENDTLYQVLKTNTRLTQKMAILSKEDFAVNGHLFLVLEPVCKAIQIDYDLVREDGVLSVITK